VTTAVSLKSWKYQHAWDFSGGRAVSDFMLAGIAPECSYCSDTNEAEDDGVSAPIGGQGPPAA
jgi:hypothetical protein